MKKRLLSIVLAVFVLTLGFSACTKTATQPADADGDAIEQAVYDYLTTEVSKSYDKADACIPTMTIIGTEVSANDNVKVYGDFWVENYDIKGDTLECTSGGHYPGVFHLQKDGNTYKVTKFENPEDGSSFNSTAKKLFGSYYDAWMEIYQDSDARQALRTKTIAEYVKANGLKVTQYHDYGWDQVALPTK